MPREPLIRKSLPIFDDDAEEDFRSSRRLAELKKSTDSYMDEELDKIRSSTRRFGELKKSTESALDDDIRSSVRRFGKREQSADAFLDDFTAIKERPRSSFIKARSIIDLDDFSSDLGAAKSEIFKATATSTSASSRASATRERLANIECEMSERADKQMQREKRSANLKKFMSEAGVEASKVVKKVTF